METRKYQLSSECFICLAGNSVVYLDARSGVFCQLTPQESLIISEHVPGWPQIASQQFEDSAWNVPTDAQIVDTLLRRGVLVEDSSKGKRAIPAEIAIPSATLMDEYERIPVKIGLKDLALFFAAAISATFAIRLSVLQLSRRLSTRTNLAVDFDIDTKGRMRAAFANYLKLRPLLWGTRNQMLFERLVLLKFLRYRGIFCNLVLGVSVDPFRQYYWLQAEEIVIDAESGVAASFTPILIL